MSYQLGVDVGTSYSAAAVADEHEVRMLPLGNRTPVTPSVVFLRDDGSLAVGEVAEQLATANPRLAAREFKRLVGSQTGARLQGRPTAPEWLMAQVAGWIAQRAASRLGGPASGVVVAHPATWWATKIDLLRSAVERSGLDQVRTITEPEAAAMAYAAAERVGDGRVVVVYDLGGGTFDVAILRRQGARFVIVGRPEGLEHLGGIDFDAAVRAHVNRALRGALDRYDPTDPAVAPALARLRAECVAAKEALSSDSTVVVPVLLPGLKEEVRLTRAEFEAMVRPAFIDTLGATRRALRSSGVAVRDIDAVLLVGGSSRIPLVAQMVGAELGRPVAVDAHPKHLVALGAALSGVHGLPDREAARAKPVVAPPPPTPPTQTPTPPTETPTPPIQSSTPPIQSPTPPIQSSTPPIQSPTPAEMAGGRWDNAPPEDAPPGPSLARPPAADPTRAATTEPRTRGDRFAPPALIAATLVLAVIVVVMAWALFAG